MFETAKAPSPTAAPERQPVRQTVAPEPSRPQTVARPAATPPAAPVYVKPPVVAEAPARVVPVAPIAREPVASSAAQMIAGPGTSLKGDLCCDLLRVEGTIEGDVKARKLLIAAGGTLLGTAEIEDAEIEGQFEGTLLVAGLLVVRGGGRVSGKFQYGEIEIERGGMISGEIRAHEAPALETPSKPAVPLQAVPPQKSEGDQKNLRGALFARS